MVQPWHVVGPRGTWRGWSTYRIRRLRCGHSTCRMCGTWGLQQGQETRGRRHGPRVGHGVCGVARTRVGHGMAHVWDHGAHMTHVGHDIARTRVDHRDHSVAMICMGPRHRTRVGHGDRDTWDWGHTTAGWGGTLGGASRAGQGTRRERGTQDVTLTLAWCSGPLSPPTAWPRGRRRSRACTCRGWPPATAASGARSPCRPPRAFHPPPRTLQGMRDRGDTC